MLSTKIKIIKYILGDTRNTNSGGLNFFTRHAQQNANDGTNATVSPTASQGLNSSSSNQNLEGKLISEIKQY